MKKRRSFKTWKVPNGLHVKKIKSQYNRKLEAEKPMTGVFYQKPKKAYAKGCKHNEASLTWNTHLQALTEPGEVRVWNGGLA